MSYYGYWHMSPGRIVKCGHCANGVNRAGKRCKYCNGTGLKTKKVGD